MQQAACHCIILLFQWLITTTQLAPGADMPPGGKNCRRKPFSMQKILRGFDPGHSPVFG
jgi:hypothetical protein